MNKLGYRFDEEGYFVEPVVLEKGMDMTNIVDFPWEEPCVRPRFVKGKWVDAGRIEDVTIDVSAPEEEKLMGIRNDVALTGIEVTKIQKQLEEAEVLMSQMVVESLMILEENQRIKQEIEELRNGGSKQ